MELAEEEAADVSLPGVSRPQSHAHKDGQRRARIQPQAALRVIDLPLTHKWARGDPSCRFFTDPN
jgi:hypothetical protein